MDGLHDAPLEALDNPRSGRPARRKGMNVVSGERLADRCGKKTEAEMAMGHACSSIIERIVQVDILHERLK